MMEHFVKNKPQGALSSLGSSFGQEVAVVNTLLAASHLSTAILAFVSGALLHRP